MTVNSARLRDRYVPLLTLFTSAGTLACCALPILLVSLGMGATVVSLTSSAPWLITLSEHKNWVFAIALAMLLLCAWFIYNPRRSCPVEPQLANACRRLDKINRWIYWTSVVIWASGFFAAFLLNPLSRWLGA